MTYDDEMLMDKLSDKCIKNNSTDKWIKHFKTVAENNYKVVKERNEQLKKTKDGKISPSNFIWGDDGDASGRKDDDYKSLELSSEEEEYKKENDEMFGLVPGQEKKPPERNPNNPYLTQAERSTMKTDESGEEIDATEDDGIVPEPNPYEKVKIGYSPEYGLVVTVGNCTGCIAKEEIQQLIDYAEDAMNGKLDDSDDNEGDGDEGDGDEGESEENDEGDGEESDESEDEPQLKMVKISTGIPSFADLVGGF